jgi:predicted lactoylglutathione lyase
MAETRSRRIFVNLAVRNLKKSVEFFSAGAARAHPNSVSEVGRSSDSSGTHSSP